MSAVQHSYPEPVKTVHGDGLLIGVDGRGNACVCFLPGDAPELEKAHWLGGPNYACMIPEEDVIRVS